MKGLKCSQTSRKRIFVICSIFVSVFCCLLYSVSSFAQGVWIARFGARVAVHADGTYVCDQSSYSDNYLYNDVFYGCALTGIQVYSQNVQASGNSVVWNGKLNIVKRLMVGADNSYYNRFKGEQNFNFTGLKFGNVNLNVVNQQKNYWRTNWSDGSYDYQTLTIAWTISATAAQDIVNQTAVMTMSIFPNDGSSFDYYTPYWTSSRYYFENNNEAMEILFTPNGLEGMNQLINENQKLQIQNQTIINQNNETNNNLQTINDSINNQYEQQDEKYQNQADSNESTIGSDTSAQETQATNLITVISTVITAIKDTNANNCRVRIPTTLYATNVDSSYFGVDLCPPGYITFINTGWTPHSSIGTISIKNIFTNVIMVAFLISIVIAILNGILRLYNLFLGGKH